MLACLYAILKNILQHISSQNKQSTSKLKNSALFLQSTNVSVQTINTDNLRSQSWQFAVGIKVYPDVRAYRGTMEIWHGS